MSDTKPTKVRMLTDRLVQLKRDSPTGFTKVLVFSQHDHFLASALDWVKKEHIKFVVFRQGLKRVQLVQAVTRFRHEKDVEVMFISEYGSKGRDLSFVQHVFLLNPVWDASVEKQVVGRAHRMGAEEGDIHVYRLAMRHSIEEQLVAMASAESVQAPQSGDLSAGTCTGAAGEVGGHMHRGAGASRRESLKRALFKTHSLITSVADGNSVPLPDVAPPTPGAAKRLKRGAGRA